MSQYEKDDVVDTLLTPHEARVIGCLIEKEVTTPEQYPLSLNALTNACNQKSNREPVMDLDESTVQATVDGLVKKHLVSEKSGFGSRVVKYQHRFFNSEFGGKHFSAQEMGVVCVLLLRGPQTPGELRSRTNRLCHFNDVNETEVVLQRLMERDDGPYVVRLAREPGKRESRYAHLFCGEVEMAVSTAEFSSPPSSGGDDERIAQLEQLVMELFDEVSLLKQQLAEMKSEVQ
jgi:hypothetical protein